MVVQYEWLATLLLYSFFILFCIVDLPPLNSTHPICGKSINHENLPLAACRKSYQWLRGFVVLAQSRGPAAVAVHTAYDELPQTPDVK